MCELKDVTTEEGERIRGWFKSSKVCDDGENQGKICSSNEECPGSECVEELCIGGENAPTPDYRPGGKENDIYQKYYYNETSHKWLSDSNYKGYVGLCPEQYNMCTRYIDPQDEDQITCRSKVYYYIDNEKIEDRIAECSEKGGVSLKEGCVLFDKVSVGSEAIFNSEATYGESESEERNNEIVIPITEEGEREDGTAIIGELDAKKTTY